MDTYFFDYKEAYKEARKQNRFTPFNNLQICYYNGEHKESPYQNLIGVPVDTFCDYMTETPNRGMSLSNLEFGKGFTKEQETQITAYLQQLQQIAYIKKKEIGDQYREAIQQQEPNFNEPLRILFVTTRGTTVLQYVTKNLADAFDSLGYQTFVSIERNEMQNWGANDSHGNVDFAWHLKNIYEFNPHIIVSLDWINNTFLNDKVFNFVWFQDPMEVLFDQSVIKLRERDYYFYLVDQFKDALIKKNIDSNKLFYQSFCTNKKIFFEDAKIPKENKIVFLGVDYGFDKKITIADEIYEELYNHIENNSLSEELIQEYSSRTNINFATFKSSILPSIVRRRTIVWMCSLKDITVEIYGADSWLLNPITAPFYKGLLPYGEEMAKVYNSAKYALVSHVYYRYQQRLFEISACGTIPVVYKGNLQDEAFNHEDNILSFSTFEELQNMIGKEPMQSPKQITEDISYEKMAMKIIEIVKQNV